MSSQTKPAPAQKMLKKEICLIESELNTVRQRRDAGFGNEETFEQISHLDKCEFRKFFLRENIDPRKEKQ